MNYLIWKGKDSREIEGLVICELPPITKPQMRMTETVIDGVDGSIIEELGYSSYDKTLSIGIKPNADINEIIAYFTGDGEVVFSNEADKYYKARIVNQIDFTRLVRYRVATVAFRVQPFKFEYSEEDAVSSNGEVAGEFIQLEDKKITEIAIEGRSTQSGTPAPDAPVEIVSVGENTTKNLANQSRAFDKNDQFGITMTYIPEEDCFCLNGTNAGGYTNIGCSGASSYEKKGIVGQSYVASIKHISGTATIPSGSKWDVCFFFGQKSDPLANENANWITIHLDNTYNESTAVCTKEYIGSFWAFIINGASFDNYKFKVQLEVGTKATEYTPYVPCEHLITLSKCGKNLFDDNKDYGYNYVYRLDENGDKVFYCRDESQDEYLGLTITDIWDLANRLGVNLTISFDIKSATEGSILVYSLGKKELSRLTGNSYVSATTEWQHISYTVDTIYKESDPNGEKCALSFYGGAYGNGVIPYVKNLQIELGDVASEYEPFERSVVTIPLEEPLRSVPNGVKDVAYIKNNKLYVDRYVGSVILNGSDGWKIDDTYEGIKQFSCAINDISMSKEKNLIDVMSDHFKGDKWELSWTKDNVIVRYNNESRVRVMSSKFATVDEFKTWLSTHNTQVDYELATPVTEELGEIAMLNTSEGVNNVSNSENANMAITYVGSSVIADNLGNCIAKPVMEIKGSGAVEIAVNGNTMFRYTFPVGENAVIIDSEKQDAYLGSFLKNRNMVGEFPTLGVGRNKITWEGNVTSISISSKSRWL